VIDCVRGSVINLIESRLFVVVFPGQCRLSNIISAAFSCGEKSTGMQHSRCVPASCTRIITNWHDNAMMLHLGRKRIVGFRITVSGLELIAADVAQNTVYNIF